MLVIPHQILCGNRNIKLRGHPTSPQVYYIVQSKRDMKQLGNRTTECQEMGQREVHYWYSVPRVESERSHLHLQRLEEGLLGWPLMPSVLPGCFSIIWECDLDGLHLFVSCPLSMVFQWPSLLCAILCSFLLSVWDRCVHKEVKEWTVPWSFDTKMGLSV